jgi:hypothetical protein
MVVDGHQGERVVSRVNMREITEITEIETEIESCLLSPQNENIVERVRVSRVLQYIVPATRVNNVV